MFENSGISTAGNIPCTAGIRAYQIATIITTAAIIALTTIQKNENTSPLCFTVCFKIYSTISHIINDVRNATRYQSADFITIFSNNNVVENIESIRSDVETGIPLNLVRNTSMSGKITTYHSTSNTAYHFASKRP